MLNQFPNKSPQEVLDSFNHIELTEDEQLWAIIDAKIEKQRRIDDDKKRERENERRRLLTSTQWSYKQTESFMKYRGNVLFTAKNGRPAGFLVDNDNQMVYELFLNYFSNEKAFESLAVNAGVVNPSLEKGILLVGGFGVGKTAIMKLFSRNQRQVFEVANAKVIANDYQSAGPGVVVKYEAKTTNAVNDTERFFQKYSGLCIDDIGTEDEKNNFGNKRNVIGDLIEIRYSHGECGVFLHGTTNLTAKQIKEYYGERVASRMREVFNVIELGGSDRRR